MRVSERLAHTWPRLSETRMNSLIIALPELLRIIPISPLRQPRASRILRNIPPQILELRFAPHQVIELLHLPELAAATKCLLYLPARKSFPTLALREKHVLLAKCHQNMHVVWHH